MAPDSHPIFQQVDRRSGMTVPEGYFADFASRMMEQIPQPAPAPIKPVTLWSRCRPYLYMAAMFSGIWVLMWMFNHISSNPIESMNSNPIISEVLKSEQFYDYYVTDNDINQYELIDDMYNSGITLANLD